MRPFVVGSEHAALDHEKSTHCHILLLLAIFFRNSIYKVAAIAEVCGMSCRFKNEYFSRGLVLVSSCVGEPASWTGCSPRKHTPGNISSFEHNCMSSHFFVPSLLIARVLYDLEINLSFHIHPRWRCVYYFANWTLFFLRRQDVMYSALISK